MEKSIELECPHTAKTPERCCITDGKFPAEQRMSECVQCIVYRKESDRLKKEIKTLNQRLSNIKHLVDSQQKYCIEAEGKQIDSEHKAKELTWELKRTKDRFGRIEIDHKLSSLLNSLKINKHEVVEAESRVRSIRIIPNSSKRYLEKAKRRLNQLRKERQNMKAMLEHAQRDREKHDEIILASINGDNEKLKQLVLRGVSVNITDEVGYSAFKYVCYKRNKEAVEFMLKNAEVDLNYVDTMSDHVLLIVAKGGSTEILLMLLQHGADPNVASAGGQVPLHEVCFSGRLQAVQILVEFGAKTDICDSRGNSAIFYAVKADNTNVVLHLLKSGARVDLKNADGMSIIEVARRFGSTKILYLLHRYQTQM